MKLVLSTVIFYCVIFFISAYLVRSYYREGLPYYDSIGIYWNMFSIMDTTRTEGISKGFQQAMGYPLSWIQSFFAVGASFVLLKEPQQLIVLNFLCIALLLLSLIKVAKILGMSSFQQVFLFLIPLIPAALFWWKGGYLDMRRDASFVTLLGASYFLLSSFLLKPTVLSGVFTGIFFGLTQWSRGNVLFHTLIAIFALYISYFTDKILRRSWKKVLVKSVVMISTFAAVALPFYLYNYEAIVLKYKENWAILGDRIQSLLDFKNVGLIFLMGQNANELNASFLLIGSIAVLIIVLFGKRIVTFDRKSLVRNYSLFLKAGILLYLFTFIFNVFVVGIKKNLGDYQVYLPFFPLIIGMYSVFAFLIASLKVNPKKTKLKQISIIALFVIVLSISTLRSIVNMPARDKALHDQVVKLVNDVGVDLSGKSIAYLWFEAVNVHTLNFYLTKTDYKPIITSSRVSPNVDIENPPNSYMTIEDQQAEFAQGLRAKEFIVLSDDSSLYGDKDGFFFMFKHGKPVIEDLLRDSAMEKYYSFAIGNTPFVILKNTSLQRK